MGDASVAEQKTDVANCEKYHVLRKSVNVTNLSTHITNTSLW